MTPQPFHQREMSDRQRRRPTPRILIPLAMAVLSVLWSWDGPARAQETVTIRVWTVGPDDPAIGRARAFESAGERLNHYLEREGSGVQVRVEAEFNTVSWSSFKQRNLLALQTGDPRQIADIIVTGHEDIAPYATAGYIIPLDRYIARYAGVYGDIVPELWPAVRFAGRTWGIPRDPDARMVWIRKDKLRAIRWSEEEIEALRAQAFAGEFTLDDLAEMALAFQKAGVVDYGIVHRPTPGTDWLAYLFVFGGRLEDRATGRLVIHRSAALKTLRFIQRLASELEIVPKSMTSWAWPAIHQAFLQGEAGILLTGGTWHWGQWQFEYDVDEESLFKTITWIPLPAAGTGVGPVSISHPLATLITSASAHQELAFLLTTFQYASDLQAESVLKSGHLAVRRAMLEYAPYVKSRYQREVSALLDLTGLSPNHPKAPLYWESWFQAIQAVESGALRPEEALRFWLRRMRHELGEGLIVEG